MNKILGPNFYMLIALIILGAFFVSARFKDAPGIIEIRANPTLFKFDDYDDKIELHTRLSTLFPNGSPERDIITFFKLAEIPNASRPKGQCTYYITYGNRATFIFGDNDKQLKAIQADDWPAYNEICPKVKEPAVQQEIKNEGELPLMPLP